MRTVTHQKIVNEIKNSRGQFFSLVIKKKKDGTIRQLMCKLNYDKLDDFANGLVPIFDFNVNGYRSVRINGILEASIGGKNYKAKS